MTSFYSSPDDANDIAYVPQILPKTKNEDFETLKLSHSGLKNSDTDYDDMDANREG